MPPQNQGGTLYGNQQENLYRTNKPKKPKKKGYGSYILYLIQREDCKFFKIAKDIDEEYKNTFDAALKNGVKILCYDCKLNNEEIRINKQIYYEK